MSLWIKGAALHGAALFLFAQSAALVDKSERAQLWMAQGRFAEAAGLYEELTRALPGNAGLLLNLGMARHMGGNDLGAIAPLEASLRIQELSPALLFLGSSHMHLGQPAKAFSPLRKFVALQPDHREARQMLAEAATATGNHLEAAIQLARFAAEESAQPALWYSLGRAWQAVAASEMAKLPEDSGYWLALAADGRNKRRQSRAGFLLYRKAIEKLPRQRGFHAAIAEIYRDASHEDWAKVEESYEAALGTPVCQPVPALECHFAAARHRDVLASPLGTPRSLLLEDARGQGFGARGVRQDGGVRSIGGESSLRRRIAARRRPFSGGGRVMARGGGAGAGGSISAIRARHHLGSDQRIRGGAGDRHRAARG